jgi:hypothetical protein
LYRRAVRLRRLTGNTALKSRGEKDSENMGIKDIAQMTLVRPFVLGFSEPIVAAWNLYIALIYGACGTDQTRRRLTTRRHPVHLHHELRDRVYPDIWVQPRRERACIHGKYLSQISRRVVADVLDQGQFVGSVLAYLILLPYLIKVVKPKFAKGAESTSPFPSCLPSYSPRGQTSSQSRASHRR